MCGISGIYNLKENRVSPVELTAQTETIRHRGPNEGGQYCAADGRCGLGVRRLSIIDVAEGQQPLQNETGQIWLVYNGETYNHRELRRELVGLGHRFAGGNDGEVIIHGYEAWGIDGVLQRLRGMAAFALWDETRQTLFLARDRFGIKPLYYTIAGNRLVFGSEIKALLAEPTVRQRRSLNLSALQAMFAVGFVPGPATMFSGVEKLPPAHYLQVDTNGISLHRYWRLTYTETDRRPEKVIVADFMARLQEAVQLRLMSEVPLGALLSGGLDSSTLVALMQPMLSQPVQTVSIGFAEAAYNEAAQAETAARFIGSEHHAIQFKLSDFDRYPALLDHLEAPQCAATALPIYHLYRACAETGLTVVLTGEGADELLGGYFWHRGDRLARPLLHWPAWARQAISALPMSAAARRVLRGGPTNPADRFRQWLAVTEPTVAAHLFSGEVQAARSPKNSLLSAWSQTVPADAHPVNQFLGLDAATRMVDFINFEVDKMSMAHSIEARVPFLDHRLWEFAATLPVGLKLRGRVEKYLLRAGTRGLLPEPIRRRRKQGLAAPYRVWLAQPRLPAWAEEALSAGDLRRVGVFNPAAVATLRQRLQRGDMSVAGTLMGVLSTQVWYRRFM